LVAIARLEKDRPNDPITYNLKGGALLANKDLTGARKAFERALQLQPTQFAAAMNLAQLDLRNRDFQAARDRFEEILKHDKSNVESMLALSKLAAMAGVGEEAIWWVERARQ